MSLNTVSNKQLYKYWDGNGDIYVVGMTQFGFTHNTIFILLSYFTLLPLQFYVLNMLSVGKSKDVPSLHLPSETDTRTLAQ